MIKSFRVSYRQSTVRQFYLNNIRMYHNFILRFLHLPQTQKRHFCMQSSTKLIETLLDSYGFLISTRPTGGLTIYLFKVIPFRTANSPFMLNATLDLHLNKFLSQLIHRLLKTRRLIYTYADNLFLAVTQKRYSH